MKKVKLMYGLLAIMLFTLLACGSNEGDIVPSPKVEELKLEINQVALSEGADAKVAIVSGNGGYKAYTSDSNIVTATIQEKNVVITAKKSGEAQITVIDSQNKKAVVNVKVSSSISIDKENIILQKGATATINIPTGEGNYLASSENQSVATAEVNGNKIIIKGISVGETNVKVRDTKTEQEKTIHVTVKELLIDNAGDIVLQPGESKNITIQGSDNFSANIDNDNVASVSTAGNTITILGKNSGNAKLIISDNDTHQEIMVNILVKAEEKLELDKYSVSINRKSSEIVRIISYNDKPYSYIDNYEVIITKGSDKIKVDKQHYDGINHHVKVTSKGGLGEAKFVIKDKITNQQKEVIVTINSINLNILTTTDNISIEEDETKVLQVQGNGDYTISLKNSNIANVTIQEEEGEEYGILKITGVSAGVTQLTLKDNHTGQTKTLSITVTAAPKDFVVNSEGVLVHVNSSAIVPNLVIPDFVKVIPSKYDNKFFAESNVITKVTMMGVKKIGEYSFASIDNLTEVIIGKDVTKIDKAAFALNKNLTKVKIFATTPPTLGKYSFTGVETSQRTLYVPNSALSSYQTEEWQEYFGNIVGF